MKSILSQDPSSTSVEDLKAGRGASVTPSGSGSPHCRPRPRRLLGLNKCQSFNC